MVTLRPMVGVLALALPASALAIFTPLHITAQSNYAGTNGGFNYLPDINLDLGGSSHWFLDSVAAPGSGNETAWIERMGSADADSIAISAMSGTTQHSSIGVGAWYDFVVSAPEVRFNYQVTLNRLVWWDMALVRLYDVTGGTILATHESTETGSDVVAVTPSHTLRLYTGLNQNNLNGFSYPAGDTSFFASGSVSALPEPITLTALGLGILALARRRSR